MLVDLIAVNDDDHMLAVYKINNKWGAIAKSNFTTITFREPIYRSLKELIMTYFDFYFNLQGEKSLRKYSLPFNLDKYKDWMTTDKDVDFIGQDIDMTRHFSILDKKAEKNLSLVSKKLLQASMLGSDPKGFYDPD